MALKLLKGLLFALALWFFAEWAYVSKAKPFLQKEFGGGLHAVPDADSVVAGDTASTIHGLDISVLKEKKQRISTVKTGFLLFTAEQQSV